eukprot:gene1087-10606_t
MNQEEQELKEKLRNDLVFGELMNIIKTQNHIVQTLQNENVFLKQENQILKTKIVKFMNPPSKSNTSVTQQPTKKRKLENNKKEEQEDLVGLDLKFIDQFITNDDNSSKIEEINESYSFLKKDITDKEKNPLIDHTENIEKNIPPTITNEVISTQRDDSLSNVNNPISNAIFNVLQQTSPENGISVKAIQLVENILDNVDELVTTKTIESIDENENEIIEEENLNKILRNILPEKLANNAINYAKNICNKPQE